MARTLIVAFVMIFKESSWSANIVELQSKGKLDEM